MATDYNLGHIYNRKTATYFYSYEYYRSSMNHNRVYAQLLPLTNVI